MRETANARSASGPWNKFRAGLDELHDLQNEYVTRAMALNRDLYPSTFEILMANAEAIGRRAAMLGEAA